MIDWIIITEDLNRIKYTFGLEYDKRWRQGACLSVDPLSLSNKFSVSLSKSNS